MKRIGSGLALGLWLLMLASHAFADPLSSSSPLPFFKPDLLQEVFYGEVFDLAGDPRWVCGVAEPRECDCVDFTRPGYGLSISRWSEEGPLVIWHQVQLYDPGTNSHFFMDKVVFDRRAPVFEFEGFEYRVQGEFEVLRVSVARMERTYFEARDVSWVRGVLPELTVPGEKRSGCALSVGRLSRAVDGARTEATAASATFDGRSWRIDDLRLMGGRLKVGSIGLPSSEYSPEQGRSGWLPGAVTTSKALTELESGLFFAPPTLAATVHLSMPLSYGLGLSHFSVREAEEGKQFQRLRVDLRYVADQERLVLSSLGTSRLGRGPVHLSADLEMPGYGALWGVQRLERSASFRAWQLSRAGVALSSGSHFLQIQGGHLVIVDPLSFEEQAALFTHTLYFGSRYELGLGSELHVAARGRIVNDEYGEESGFAGARLMVQRPFGSRDRAHVLPWVSGALAYGVFPLERGIAVGTTGQVFVGGETGMALEGRFARVRHRVRPRLIGIGEVVSFGGRDEPSPEAESTTVGVEQMEGLRLMGSIIDQGLVFNEGWRVDFPLAAFALENSESPWGLDLAGAWRLRGPGAWRASGAMICRQGCSYQVLQGELQWPVRDKVMVGHHLSRDRDSRASAILGLLTGASPALLPGGSAGQALDAEDIGWFYRHSLSLATEPARFELAIPGTWGAATLPGIEARVRLGTARLGWYLGLDGAVELSSGRWLAMIGMGL